MIGRVVKRLAHRVVRAFVLNPVLRAVTVLVVFAVIGFGAYEIVMGSGSPVALPGVPSLSAATSSAPETFLKGNQAYDANLVWSSLNDESQQRFRDGGGVQAIQSQLDAARQKGIKLEQINYIGKKDLPDGTSMQFYVVASTTPQAGGHVQYIPYVFTVDQTGKIAKVE